LPVIVLLPALQFLIGFINQAVDKVLPAPTWFWELFERILNNNYGFWGAAYKVVLVAPIVEETLFRGIIMYGLMRNYKSWYAILLSGILFSLFHLNPWQMTYTFFLGLLLGWLMVRTKSLPLTILVHSINNLIVLFSISFPEMYAKNIFFRQPEALKYTLSIIAVFITVALITFLTRKKLKPTS
jgi:membrane protease YdiL (CAAX protease family)